jgi:hypothetical protein
MISKSAESEFDLIRLRLAHQVELLAAAIDAVHRLDRPSVASNRLVDLTRHATFAPFAVLALQSEHPGHAAEFSTSGEISDEIARATSREIMRTLGQLDRWERSRRSIQFQVSAANAGHTWRFEGVAIQRCSTPSGILGVLVPETGSTLGPDEIRMLELLAKCAAIVMANGREGHEQKPPADPAGLEGTA